MAVLCRGRGAELGYVKDCFGDGMECGCVIVQSGQDASLSRGLVLSCIGKELMRWWKTVDYWMTILCIVVISIDCGGCKGRVGQIGMGAF